MDERRTSMNTHARILIPLDGSQRAEAALPVAARLAHDLRAEVVLVRVVPPPRAALARSAGDLLPAVDLAEWEATAELRRYGAMLEGRPVTHVVLVGRDPAAEMTAWLGAHPVDLVVLATGERPALPRLFRRGIEEALVRSGLAPVVLVRPRQPVGAPRVVEAGMRS